MEKTSSITSSEYIASSFQNISVNSKIQITKIEEMLQALEKASKSIIIPVLKIEKKITLQLNAFAKNYSEIKTKAESAFDEMNKNEDVTNVLNITDLQLNQKYANEHEQLITFFKSVNDTINLFTELFKSQEFNELIKGFDKIIKDDEIYEEDDLGEFEGEIKLKKIKRFSKNKKDTSSVASNGRSSSGTKTKKRIKPTKKLGGKPLPGHPKKKKGEKDLLEVVQQEFPTSSYVQKISKTFLRRRLFKKIIYKHVFSYSDGKYTDERIRSSGDSTIYKYAKFIFEFRNHVNVEQFVPFFKPLLKQCFIRKVNDKTLIIAGKLGMQLNDILDNHFRKPDLGRDYEVSNVSIEFYEFYEELVNEFDSLDNDVTIFCDEKLLTSLTEDWIMLKAVRDFVTRYKKRAEQS